MKKLIGLLGALIISLSPIISVQAETISFDTADMTFVNFFSNTYGYELRANRTDFGGEFVNLKIPVTSQILYASGGINSSLLFYSEDKDIASAQSGDYIGEIDVDDLEPTGPYPAHWFGAFQIDLTDYFTDQEISKIASVELRLMVNFQVPPSGFAQFLEDNVALTFGDTPEPPTVTFIHENEVLFETTYIGFIDPPPNEPLFVDGYAFLNWVDQSGDTVNFSNPYSGDQIFYSTPTNVLTVQYFVNDVFTSFQTVTRETQTLLTPPTPPAISGQQFEYWELPDGSALETDRLYTFTNSQRINAYYSPVTEIQIAPPSGAQPFNPLIVLLEGFGLNNQFGYIFFMLLVFVPLNLFFAWVKIGVVPIAIGNFALIALFLYMQFMPFWFTFILVIGIISGLIAMTKGVINLE